MSAQAAFFDLSGTHPHPARMVFCQHLLLGAQHIIFQEITIMRNVKLPSWGTVLAWLGVLGTITGLIAFIFGGNLPDLLGLTTPGLSQEELLSTMIALQSDRADAELQLTQIAVANLAAANESTAQALDQLLSNSQATLTAVASGADSVLATQNAVAADRKSTRLNSSHQLISYAV